jgi:hypothetical protein
LPSGGIALKYLLGVALVAAALAHAGPATAYETYIGQRTLQSVQSHYYVYCANGKIEVDGRDPEQMRIARGSGVCMLSQFGFRSDAQSFAEKNFGGVGKPCSCR